jgi:hypothetical protein
MGATAALAIMAGGTAMSAYGQMKSGRDTNKLFQQNAQIAEYQAKDAEARGKVGEKQSRRMTEKVIGSQRVSLAGQGVDVNRGSALDVQADAAYLGKDFQAVQELETIVKTKTAIMRVVEVVLADRVIAVKMINNKDCCETVALE